MRVLMTGQVGLDKESYLKEVNDKVTQQGLTFGVESIGPRMIENYTGEIDDTTILNLPKIVLDLLRQMTWKQILTRLKSSEQRENDIFVLNTHSVFRWLHGFFPALDLELVAEFDPDMVVVLIDDVLKVKKGLQGRGTDIFEFWELFAWREEEIWFSKFIANSIGKLLSKDIKFFVVPKAQGAPLLTKLMIEEDRPKTYMSFPITGMPDEEVPEIEKFKSMMNTEFIAFDPYSIEDRKLTLAYYTVEDEIKENVRESLKSLPIASPSRESIWFPYKDELSPLTLTKFKFDTELLGRELLAVLHTIDGQIVSRDYLLIDQVDFLVMYIRADERGEPRISAGCQSEMIYAYTTGKKVYAIFPGGEKRLSPWITQFSKAFRNVEDASKFILREHKRGDPRC